MGSVRRRLEALDERVIRLRDVVPEGDPLAVELWEDLSDEQRQSLRWTVYHGHPVDDPADAVVALALLDALARRRSAARPRQLVVASGIVLVVVIVVAVLYPPTLGPALLALLAVLSGVGLIAAWQHQQRQNMRRWLEALAAAYRRLAG